MTRAPESADEPMVKNTVAMPQPNPLSDAQSQLNTLVRR